MNKFKLSDKTTRNISIFIVLWFIVTFGYFVINGILYAISYLAN